MSATLDAPAGTKVKKIRYRNTESGTFAWVVREDLPEYALEQPAVQKQLGLLSIAAPVESKVNDYSADIEHWREELRTAVADLRAARDDRGRNEARRRAEQYKLAIDIYAAAEMIPAEMVQFGSYRSDFFFRVPPRLDEYEEMSPVRVGTAHRYLTADPVEIAYLRTIKDFDEVPVGHVYSRGEGQRDGLWVDLAFYERQKQAGQAV